MDRTQDFMTWFKRHHAAWVGMFVLGVVIIAFFTLWGYMNGLRNEGIAYETQLVANYKANQSYLSSYEAGFYETLGVANLKSAKLDQILLDAVRGRYEGNTSAQPGGGSLFSAIAEAYPNLDLNVYDKIVDYIKGKRAGFNDAQTGLLDVLRHYDLWRRSGILQHVIISILGFPSHDLVACAAEDDCKYGEEAEERMRRILVTEGTQKAYHTGVMQPLAVPQK
ncbi:hypothetical protein HY091_02880 [Candidatus Kaiserbacteria bacterium]|nr:hypothetical protein [Candidatus Kaiserbacteria bacterium]